MMQRNINWKLIVFKFLAGLIPEYDQATARIRESDPLSTLMQDCSFVQGGESRRNIMVETQSQDKLLWQLFHNEIPEKQKLMKLEKKKGSVTIS